MRHQTIVNCLAVQHLVVLASLTFLFPVWAQGAADPICRDAPSNNSTPISGPQGESQILVTLPDGGSAVCAPNDEGGLSVVIRAYTGLNAIKYPSHTSLTTGVRIVTTKGDSGVLPDHAAIISGHLHRLTRLPVNSSEAPYYVPIKATSSGWTTTLKECSAHRMSAPLHRFGTRTWSVEIGETVYPLRMDEDGAFFWGPPVFRHVDDDGEVDALISSYDRLGTGPGAYLSVLLGCGGGTFALVGQVSLGYAGKPAEYRVKDSKLYISAGWIPPRFRLPDTTTIPARRYHIHPESRGLRGTTCPADGCEPAPGT